MAHSVKEHSPRFALNRDPAHETNHREKRSALAVDKIIQLLAQWSYEKVRHEHYCINNTKILEKDPRLKETRIKLITKLEELIRENRTELLTVRGLTDREIEERLRQQIPYLQMLELMRGRENDPHEESVGRYLPADGRFHLNGVVAAVLEALLTQSAPRGAIFIRSERRNIRVELVNEEVLELRAYDRHGSIIEPEKLLKADLFLRR